MAAPASRKPWVLVLLISLPKLALLAMPDVSAFVPGRWEHFSPVVRRTTCQATNQSAEWDFEIGPVLREAHQAWGRRYEDHVVKQFGSHYQTVVRDRFEVDMGKQGQIDFLGVGEGIEAWEAFAKEYSTQMCNATRSILQRPHFLIAEIGLTSATLKKKFKEKARSLELQGFVSRLQSSGFNAVKCLVYDGADAEDFAESGEGRQFMDEGGILTNIPYLTAETVLAKFNETTKLREENAKMHEERTKNITKLLVEIAKLREDLQLSGTDAQQTQAVWVQQLCKDGAGGYELTGNAFKITGEIADIDDLKKAIKKEAELAIPAFQINIYAQQDGKWTMQTGMSESLRETDEGSPYGYFLP